MHYLGWWSLFFQRRRVISQIILKWIKNIFIFPVPNIESRQLVNTSLMLEKFIDFSKNEKNSLQPLIINDSGKWWLKILNILDVELRRVLNELTLFCWYLCLSSGFFFILPQKDFIIINNQYVISLFSKSKFRKERKKERNTKRRN